ncbi:MAG: potassium channel family protein [Microcoleaceae cyanobacterium]
MKPYIIVCGLGRTGYQVFRLLVQQGFPVTGINETPIRGEVPEVIVGNPRSEAALISAGIQAAQALVLAGNDDSENLAILMQARILNPKIRIINRLFNANLSNRLDQILVDHISMSVSALVGPVFTFAALGKPAIGQLKLFQQTWPIREEVITPQHPWFEKDLAELWADPNRMLIYYLPIQGQLNLVSGVLENRTLASGDRLIIATKPKARTAQETLIQRLVSLGKRLQKFQQHGRSALLVALVLLITIFISALTYVSISLDTSFIDSLYFSVGMITGAGGKEEVAENAPDGIKLITAIMM